MTYMYPFDRGTETSQAFGASPGGYNPSGGHTGKDWKVWTGTPIRAAADGVIEAAQYFPDYNNEWLYGPMGGLTIVLDCGNSEPTFGYSHCSVSYVNAGDRVVKGQIIALSGDTGTATSGPHCHNEALPPNWNTYNGTYGRVDPEIYFDEYWDGISVEGSITPTTEEGFLMALTDDEQRRILALADMGLNTPGRKEGPRLLTTGEGGYIVDLLKGISTQVGHTLNKDDGGFIVNLITALRPGATDTSAIADAVIAAVGKDLAAEVVTNIGQKLGA